MDAWREASSAWSSGRKRRACVLLCDALKQLQTNIGGHQDLGNSSFEQLFVKCNVMLARASESTESELNETLLSLTAECERLRSEDAAMITSTDADQVRIRDGVVNVQYNIAFIVWMRLNQMERAASLLDDFSINWNLTKDARTISVLIGTIGSGGSVVFGNGFSSTPILRSLCLYALILLNQEHLEQCSGLIALLEPVLQETERFNPSPETLASLHLIKALCLFMNYTQHNKQVVLEAVLDSLQQNLKFCPEFAPALFLQGLVLFEMDQITDACESFKQCISKSSVLGVLPYLQLGFCQIRLNRLEQSLHSFQRCLRDSATQIEATFNIALVYEKLEDRITSVRVLDVLLKETLERPTEDANVSSARVLIELARLKRQNYEFDLPSTIFERVEQRINSNSLLERVHLTREHAFVLLRANLVESALEVIDNSLSTFPDDVQLLLYRCDAFFCSNRFEDCISSAEKTISIICSIEDAGALRSQGQFERSQKKARTDPIGRVIAGVSSSILHPVKAAQSIAPWNDNLDLTHLKALAFNNKAMCLACLGQRNEAISMLHWVLMYRPGWKDAEFNLCVLLVEDGRPVEAAVLWLKSRGIGLDCTVQAYTEELARRQPQGEICFESHVSESVSDQQMRRLDLALISEWIRRISDAKFAQLLRQRLQNSVSEFSE